MTTVIKHLFAITCIIITSCNTDNDSPIVEWEYFENSPAASRVIMNDSVLVVGTLNQGIFRKRLNDTLWVKVLTNGYGTNQFAELANYLFAATDIGVFRSSNFGLTWSICDQTLGNSQYFGITSEGNNLYTTNGSLVFESTDLGITWDTIGTKIEYAAIRSIKSFANSLFVGTETHGVYKSTDNGTTWNQIPINSTDEGSQHIYVFDNLGNHLFAGSAGDGAFLLNDAGVKFERYNKNFTGQQIFNIYCTNNWLIINAGERISVLSAAGGSIIRHDYNRDGLGMLCGFLIDGYLYVGSQSGIWKTTEVVE